MEVRIYQANETSAADALRRGFVGCEQNPNMVIDPKDYHLEYDTVVVVENLDEIFFRCQDGRIPLPSGRMFGISDIVEARNGGEKIEDGFYFCASDGWLPLNGLDRSQFAERCEMP